MRRGKSWVWGMVLVLGFAFLYGPIVSLVVYSFNASRLVTVWGGFSVRWYGELFRNEALLGAARLSLEIALLSASAAVVLGTAAAVALARFGRFPGRTLFAILLTAPMVMPEVIMGLALLLLFVALEQAVGWPEGRGKATIVIAHVTLATAYVAVVVHSRLRQMDHSLEEAAMDLGARPARVFLSVTLPLLAPSLAAGWLLAFTLSFDDLVVASFVSGPGATTLPMAVFSSARLGVSPQINALATLLVLGVGIVVTVAGRLAMGRKGGEGGAPGFK